MKTIITTTDFSDAATNAVLFAADMALQVNARLQIYHTVPDHVVLVDNLDYDMEYAETAEAMQQLETLQENIKRYTQYRLSIDVQLQYGNIDHVLEATCRQAVLPFAIVMAATGKTAVQRFWLGSETLSVSHKIRVPLLLVPQEAAFKGFKKIVIATDLNEVYDTLPLHSLTHWMKAFNAALEFVFVNGDDQFEPGDVPEVMALQTHFEKYFPSFRYIKNDSITGGINEYLNDNNPDLLIVIPKKHTPFHKSIARQFIIHPTIPTMILAGHH